MKLLMLFAATHALCAGGETVVDARPLVGMNQWVRAIAFSPDGRLLAVDGSEIRAEGGRRCSLRIWDAESGRLKRTLVPEHDTKVEPAPTWAVEFSPDGRRLAAGGPLRREPEPLVRDAFRPTKTWSGGKVQLWDVEDGRCLKTIADPGFPIRSVGFGKTLAGIDSEGRFYLYQGDASREIVTVKSADQAPDDPSSPKSTRGASFDLSARRAIAATGTEKSNLSPPGVVLTAWDSRRPEAHHLTVHDVGSSAIALSPDGGSFAMSEFGTHQLILRDFASGQVLRRLDRGTSREPSTIRYSPDGARIAAGDDQGKVDVWDVATGKLLHHGAGPAERGVRAMVFLPDRVRVASGGEGVIGNLPLTDEGAIPHYPLLIWDLKTR